ncbi:hypothetical protein [Paenibacillus glacialis]|uniref:Uncharacterized protein n=1 Tax=Paenibacillus glacialis TaxID=494026 RepID=A0A168PF17_9BACL|nr:hypothetical protein [Paenibacillus glacialis]OAB46700.1 hypothetical protein PGLA_00290 [Paenibacillus glacialis]
MNKHKYFVSVHGRSVLLDRGATTYEWEIEATEEQAQEIRDLMGLVKENEENAFLGFVFPWPDEPERVVNVTYQNALDDVYQRIYEYGSIDTRKQMKESGVNAFRHSYDG